MRTVGSAAELQRVRLIAGNMFQRGATSLQIVLDLKVHVQTVRLWRRIWKKSGLPGLMSKPHPGRPALLNQGQKKQLLEYLQGLPSTHGFTRHFWTTAMISDLIQQKFGVKYHPDWVGELLHAMGMSWQKPARRARERDEEKINAWRSEYWPQLLKKTRPKMA